MYNFNIPSHLNLPQYLFCFQYHQFYTQFYSLTNLTYYLI